MVKGGKAGKGWYRVVKVVKAVRCGKVVWWYGGKVVKWRYVKKRSEM